MIDEGTTLLFIRDVQQVHYLPGEMGACSIQICAKEARMLVLHVPRKASFRKERQFHQSLLLHSHDAGVRSNLQP